MKAWLLLWRSARGVRATQDCLEQTWAYADACGADEAHLFIFDRTSDKPWGEKIFVRHEQHGGMAITVWGA